MTINDEKTVYLPSYPNPFIGRTHHIQSIRSLLQEGGRRLITLLGPGGMGKTRLSVKIGEIMIDTFEHGVCFVALDMVTDPAQVPLYIGHRLGLKAGSRGDWTAAIITFLREKQLLLILDNLEQILDAAPVIARILDACPRVTVLATSREILDLPHEVEYPLDSLNRPNPRLFPSPEELMRFDAIDLFVQKARSSLPNFQLTEANAAAVVQICHLLDGLPLPIELAAARVKLFSPELIMTKLKSSSELLKTRSRGVVLRHQNIRQTIRWSYDLLNENEQQLFQQLALFRGGFTPDALEAICKEHEPLEVIESFLNKSLIVKGKEVFGIPRFRTLKLIRDYGLEQMQVNPQNEAYYQRFTAYYLDFIDEMDTEARSRTPAKWISLVEAEYENVEVALEWLMINRPDQAARLGTGFWRFHLSRGFLREGLDLIKKLLALTISDKAIAAQLMEAAGTLSHNLGEYLKAKDFFARCLELREAGGDQEMIVKTLNNLAWSEWRIGNFDQTIGHSEKALALSRALNNPHTEATSLNNIAWICFYRGHFEQAVDLQRQILAIRTRVKDLKGVAFAKTNLAWALIRTGSLLEAGPLIDTAIATFDEWKNQQLLTFARIIKAEFHFATRQWGAAETLLREQSLSGFEKIGDIWGIAYTCYRLGRIYFHEKDLETTRTYLTRSMELFRHSHDKHGQAITIFWWSRLCREEGDTAAAETTLHKSLVLAAEMKVNDLLSLGHLEQVRRASDRQAFEKALQYLAIANHYAEKLGKFQYEQFLVQIEPLLAPLRSFLTSKKISITAILDRYPEGIEKSHQYEWPDKEQLQDRLQKLLATSSNRPLSETHPQKDQNTPPDPGATTAVETDDPFVTRVRRVVEDRLQESKLSVKDLCREMRVSHSQLHRKLRAATGLSTSQVIRAIRMEKARELLQDPELTIAAVAYDSGFRDVDYFYRVFKQETGMTPGEFRESQSGTSSGQ